MVYLLASPERVKTLGERQPFHHGGSRAESTDKPVFEMVLAGPLTRLKEASRTWHPGAPEEIIRTNEKLHNPAMSNLIAKIGEFKLIED